MNERMYRLYIDNRSIKLIGALNIVGTLPSYADYSGKHRLTSENLIIGKLEKRRSTSSTISLSISVEREMGLDILCG